ncbi:SNF2 family N-terminal domain-containing protein [Sphaerosporella brunnea]|uniref:SNF2 family N-terminal domain-containing protein n=1 Tax=Sphaerosporella brunnea TaxID=1250544 RepID=A0A5J5ENV4_9PEZI|nr:SNF2 family N-terminal domain-containing protein [Sphaerosporella brunnea]
MTHYAGEHLDPAKTTQSIKELLEGINDEPVMPKRSRKKKAKLPKKEEDELAAMLEGTELAEKKYDLTVDPDEPPKEEEPIDEPEEEEEEDPSKVEGLKATLHPHQVRGLAFLLSREEKKARGGILADDMGLGKTVQSIALILSHPHPKYPMAEGVTFRDLSPNSKAVAMDAGKRYGRGTLVIAPVSLIKQWEGEIDRLTEDTHKLRVLVHHGAGRAKNPADLKRYDVVITTYDTVRSEHSMSSFKEGSDGYVDAVGVFGITWWRIICDEAHTIKNRLAKASLACCALKARYRWCLTGTPLQNNLDELHSLIKFLRIAPLDDLVAWKENISRPMQQNRGGVAIERLRVVLAAIMLRRTKDVLKKDAEGATGSSLKLPEREIDKVVKEFNPQEKVFYEKLEARTEESLEKMLAGFGDLGGKMSGGNVTSALVLLLRLRQACNHPHLLAGKIHKDKDSGMGLSNPRKKSAKRIDEFEEDDGLADLMGGLSVDQKKCDICFRQLSREDTEDGKVRCQDCSDDLEAVDGGKKHKKARKLKKARKPRKAVKPKRGRRTVFDSDDDDEGSQAEEGTDTEEDEPLDYEDDGFVDSQAEESEDEEDSDFDDSSYSSLLPSTKITTLLEIVSHEIKRKNKTIVFSQFTSMLDLIEPFLYQKGIAFARYDGSMKNDLREASLRRLRGDGEFAPRKGREDKNWCGVLLCSLKCGALGLNLTCASRVVILEPFWNPFIEEQAIDRVHRIGQKQDVIVYKLTIADSVEERILQLQEKKRELAKAAIGDGDMAGRAKAAKMSMNDILFLFKRDAEGNYQDRRSEEFNKKTRILKERRTMPMPVTESQSSASMGGGRFMTSTEIAEAEARRERERNSVYSRR